MKDIVGNDFEVGDTVATDTMAYRSSSLRVGKVIEFDGKRVKVQYDLDGPRKHSVWRWPSGVVKVSR